MDIGTGIAIAGLWVFPTACIFSKAITNAGMWLSIFMAISLTGCILLW